MGLKMTDFVNYPKIAMGKLDKIRPILVENGVDITQFDNIRDSIDHSPPESTFHIWRMTEWFASTLGGTPHIGWIMTVREMWVRA